MRKSCDKIIALRLRAAHSERSAKQSKKRGAPLTPCPRWQRGDASGGVLANLLQNSGVRSLATLIGCALSR